MKSTLAILEGCTASFTSGLQVKYHRQITLMFLPLMVALRCLPSGGDFSALLCIGYSFTSFDLIILSSCSIFSNNLQIGIIVQIPCLAIGVIDLITVIIRSIFLI